VSAKSPFQEGKEELSKFAQKGKTHSSDKGKKKGIVGKKKRLTHPAGKD